MKTFTIPLDSPTVPFPHVWTRCVGSCHALTALREDWRRQMRTCRDELGFEYVRFHGLLDDDMSVCLGVEKGRGGETPVCSFFNVDSIFDFLVGIDMKPFIELGFMPSPLASGTQTCFHYKGNVTPPRDYRTWGRLVEQLARHLVARYGLAAVAAWPFEVWNEPNLSYFWAGDQAAYFELYRHAAEAVKRVSPRLRVGGPATARDGWVADTVAYCERRKTPLDFVSTHHYPTDVALGDWPDIETRMARAPRGVLGTLVKETRAAAGALPLYYTEWSNSPSSRDSYHDRPYAAAFVVKTLADVAEHVDCYSYWTFSDIFEEGGLPSEPFHGGFGLLNLQGVPKPTYRAFQLLNRTGRERVPVAPQGNVDVLATRTRTGLVILLTNHHVPRAAIRTERIELRIAAGRVAGPATIERIDEAHANPRARWIAMGSPVYPTPRQIVALFRASEMKAQTVALRKAGAEWSLRLTLPPHGTAAIAVPIG